jgi:hypothetical protein
MGEELKRRLVSPLVLVPPLAVWGLVGLITYAMPINSLRLRWMERTMERVSHPADSELLARFSDLGILDGNGDHCDFMAGHLRRSPLTREALREHYRSDAPQTRVEVYSFDEPEREDNYLPNRFRLREPGDPLVPDEPGVYFVFIYDGMYPPDGDLRCW